MRTLRLTLAYDGTDFHGWQFQPDKRTLQAVVEAAVEQVTGVWTRVRSSSRTDAGVHALGQVVSFSTATRLDNDTLRRALNAVLPYDIVVCDVRDAPLAFHATYDSLRKRYRYVIQDGRIRNPLLLRQAWHVPYELDVPAMHAAAQTLLGEHDFSAYECTGSARDSSVRRVYEISLARTANELGPRIALEIEANGFLYNMVRNIVGTLVQVGRGKRPPQWMAEVLASRDRRRAGMTAPPQGLFLLAVRYPGDEGAS